MASFNNPLSTNSKEPSMSSEFQALNSSFLMTPCNMELMLCLLPLPLGVVVKGRLGPVQLLCECSYYGSAVLKPQVLWHFGAGRWVGLGCRFKGFYPWPRHLIAVPLYHFPSLLLCPSSVK